MRCDLLSFQFQKSSNMSKKMLHLEEADVNFAKCNIIIGISIVETALFGFSGIFREKKNTHRIRQREGGEREKTRHR